MGRYVPVPAVGMVLAGTGTVWEILTHGLPVPNPRDLGLEECQASHRGYRVLTVYHCLLIVGHLGLACLAIQCPLGPSLSQDLSLLPTTPTVAAAAAPPYPNFSSPQVHPC